MVGVSPDDLDKFVYYLDGRLYWRFRPDYMFNDGHWSRGSIAKSWNARYAGQEAFSCRTKQGYKTGRLNKKNYFAHTIVWALHKGCWPSYQIDHINGNKTDNRIENLRDVGKSLNAKNSKMRSDNTSGHTGVHFSSKLNKWMVQAHNKYFGIYDTLEEAIQVRKNVNNNSGYTVRHGK